MESLGTKLKNRIVKPTTQSRIAMEWLSAKEASGAGHCPAPATVESQLSRLLKDEVTAVRFFFANREDASWLLDALTVKDQQERQQLLELADELLKTDGKPPVRLVMDLTTFPSDRDTSERLFEGIRAALVEKRPVSPAALVITGAQFDVLPRSFDKLEWLRIEQVDDPDGGWKVVSTLGTRDALVISARRFSPASRWAAVELEKGRVTFEPPDALDTFGREGTLPWPPVPNDLGAIARPAEQTPPLPSSGKPNSIRKLLFDLRMEDRAHTIDASPEKRLALARALGTEATSTPAEREKAERARTEREIVEAQQLAGVSPSKVPEADLATALARASRRRVSGLALRVDDTIHLINPQVTPASHPRLVVHKLEPSPTALSRLLNGIRNYTDADFERDPTLSRLIEQLDPDRVERLAFLHARASLMHNGAVSRPAVKRPALPDGVEGRIKTLLFSTFGEVLFLVANAEDQQKRISTLLVQRAATLTRSDMEKLQALQRQAEFFIHETEQDALRLCAADVLTPLAPEQRACLQFVAPLYSEVILERSRKTSWIARERVYAPLPFAEPRPPDPSDEPNTRDEYLVLRNGRPEHTSRREKQVLRIKEWEKRKEAAEPATFPLLLPDNRLSAVNQDEWLDLFETSRALTAIAPDEEVRARVWRRLGRGDGLPKSQAMEPQLVTGQKLSEQAADIDAKVWKAADVEFAVAVQALRGAFGSQGLVQVPGDSWVLSLGNGLYAVMDVHASTKPAQPPTAFMNIGHWTPKSGVTLRTEIDSGFSAHREQVRVSVPRNLRLEGQGLVVDVQFRSAPVLHPGAAERPKVIEAALRGAGAAIKEENEQRRRDEEERREQQEEERRRQRQEEEARLARMREEEEEQERQAQEWDDDD